MLLNNLFWIPELIHNYYFTVSFILFALGSIVSGFMHHEEYEIELGELVTYLIIIAAISFMWPAIFFLIAVFIVMLPFVLLFKIASFISSKK